MRPKLIDVIRDYFFMFFIFLFILILMTSCTSIQHKVDSEVWLHSTEHQEIYRLYDDDNGDTMREYIQCEKKDFEQFISIHKDDLKDWIKYGNKLIKALSTKL